MPFMSTLNQILGENAAESNANLFKGKPLQLGDLLEQTGLGPPDLGVQRNNRRPVFLLGCLICFL